MYKNWNCICFSQIKKGVQDAVLSSRPPKTHFMYAVPWVVQNLYRKCDDNNRITSRLSDACPSHLYHVEHNSLCVICTHSTESGCDPVLVITFSIQPTESAPLQHDTTHTNLQHHSTHLLISTTLYSADRE